VLDAQTNGVETTRLIRMRDPVAWGKLIKDVLPKETIVRAFGVNIDIDANDITDDTSLAAILEPVWKMGD
jgi:hypothetical protein